MEPDRWSRRRLLATGASLVGSLAGCVAPFAGTQEDPDPVVVDADTWPLWRADPGRTGYNPATAGPSRGDVRWSLQTGSLGSPVVLGDTIFAGGDAIYALAGTDGMTRWRRTIPFGANSAPAIADDTVYATSKFALYAIDVANGDTRWIKQNGVWRHHSPTATADALYVGSTKIKYSTDFEARVLALDPRDGSQRWQADTGSNILPPFTPAVGEGRVYVGRDRVYALDAADGTRQWTFDAPDLSAFSDVVATDEAVYVAGVRPSGGVPDGAVIALDAADGTQRWRIDTDLSPSSPAVAEGSVYVTSDAVYALDATDGTVQWTFDSNRFVTASPTATDRHVYIASVDGVVRALDVRDGTTRWRVPTIGAVLTAPAVVDGAVYVGSGNGNVIAIG